MGSEREGHKAALASAAEGAGVPVEVLDALLREARTASRLRTRGVGSASLERAIQSVITARENE